MRTVVVLRQLWISLKFGGLNKWFWVLLLSDYYLNKVFTLIASVVCQKQQDELQALRSENERLKTELSKAASAGTGLQTCIGCIDMLMFWLSDAQNALQKSFQPGKGSDWRSACAALRERATQNWAVQGMRAYILCICSGSRELGRQCIIIPGTKWARRHHSQTARQTWGASFLNSKSRSKGYIGGSLRHLPVLANYLKVNLQSQIAFLFEVLAAIRTHDHCRWQLCYG